MKPVDLSVAALGGPADDFVIVQWKAEVGDHWIAPLHVHHHDDEAWYVLSGQLSFRLGDDEVVADAGSAVLARRGVPHTFRNAGDTEAVYLLVDGTEDRATDRGDPPTGGRHSRALPRS